MSADNGNKLKGVLLALSTTIVTAPSPVAARFARQTVTATTYSVLWMFLPVVYCSGWFTVSRKWPMVLPQLRAHWRRIILMGVVQAVGAWTFFWGMKFVDPTVSAFLGRSSAVFAVVIGVIALKERMNRAEVAGTIAAIVGTAVICYETGEALLAGIIAIVLSSLAFAIFTAIAKVLVRAMDPFAVMLGSTSVASVALALLGVSTGELTFGGPWSAYAAVAGASFAGEFLGQGLFYSSMKYIGFSITSVVRSALPLTVALFSYFTLGEVPDLKAWIGGAILMAGIVLITLTHARPAPVPDQTP